MLSLTIMDIALDSLIVVKLIILLNYLCRYNYMPDAVGPEGDEFFYADNVGLWYEITVSNRTMTVGIVNVDLQHLHLERPLSSPERQRSSPERPLSLSSQGGKILSGDSDWWPTCQAS